MKISFWKTGLFVITAAALLLSGCSFSINLGDTTPTSQPPAVIISPTAGQETQPPEATATTASIEPSTGTGTYKLSTTQFVLPSQAFALYPPEGWENQAKDSKEKVVYVSPDGSVIISTRFTNTGYKLSPAAFEAYINGNQENIYSTESNYLELSRELHSDQGTGMVYVTFNYNNVPQKAEHLYAQDGNVIFETVFWTDLDKWDSDVDFFNKYLDGITYYGSKVSSYETYMFVQQYVGGDNFFSLEYYTPWLYQVNKTDSKDFTSISYIAPDGNAMINIDYQNDNKTYWTKGNAGQWALSALESYYAKGSGDLKIDSDQINDKGFEQLNWHTLQNGLVGITVFFAKDTQIMKLTVVWLKDYTDTYQSSLEYIISTFASPPAQ